MVLEWCGWINLFLVVCLNRVGINVLFVICKIIKWKYKYIRIESKFIFEKIVV